MDQFRDPVVDLTPHFLAGNGPEFVIHRLNGQLHRTRMSHLDDLHALVADAWAKELGNLLDRADRCRQTDALQVPALPRDKPLQPLDGKRQMRAALVVGDGVDLVDNQRARRPQDLPAAFGREQNVQRLRRSHQDVRRPVEHLLTLVCGRVASA